MLCAAVTTAVADRLARDVSRSDDCMKRAAEAFARSAPFEPRSRLIAPNTLRVTEVIRETYITGAVRQSEAASAAVIYGAGGSSVQVAIELVKESEVGHLVRSCLWASHAPDAPPGHRTIQERAPR
jgi:hypothetical protein